MPLDLNRRALIQVSASAAVGLALSRRAGIAAPAADAVNDARQDVLGAFSGLGFTELPPLPLITVEAFNEGLRYDEARTDSPEGAWVCVQPAARVEDIAERVRPGVLACFSLAAFGAAKPPHQGILFEEILRFLTERRGLDPSRLVYVSTELFRPYLDRFETARAGRFIERPLAEAKTVGDGSGYFKPAEHPQGPEYPTVGIYYPLAGTTPDEAPAYPPPGYLEIGEATVWPLDSDPAQPEIGGLGLERLVMAAGEPAPTFEETRLALLRALEAEAERDGKALPAGYASFAAL